MSDATGRRGRVVLFNENLGGHASLHGALREVLGSWGGVDAVFCDLPPPGRLRRVLSARIPAIGPRDLDLQPVRFRVAQSVQAHRLLAATLRPGDVLHAYTQSALLCSRRLLARWPSIVATDATIAQGLYHLPYRRPTRHSHLGLRVLRRAEQAVYRSATLVVAQSRWAARSLTEAYGVEPERLRVIPYGLPDRPVRRPRPGSEPPAVCFIGASFERKGGTRLVRVVRERLGGTLTCHVVTRDPVPAAPGVVVHRDLAPGDPRLDELLARCLALVLPSEMDHSPYAVLEAMRAGVAVVATRSGAVPEIVVDGETGLLVSHDDAALATALGTLVGDPGRAAAMGRAGRRRFERCFDAGRTTAALLEVCDEARRRHRAPAGRRP